MPNVVHLEGVVNKTRSTVRAYVPHNMCVRVSVCVRLVGTGALHGVAAYIY